MVDVAADTKVMLFSPIKEPLQVGKHHGANLWSPLAAGSYADSNSL
jgi:hypothetical protein